MILTYIGFTRIEQQGSLTTLQWSLADYQFVRKTPPFMARI